MKRFLLCKNYQQYLSYLYKNNLKFKDIEYLANDIQLRGLRDIEVIEYGTPYRSCVERFDI